MNFYWFCKFHKYYISIILEYVPWEILCSEVFNFHHKDVGDHCSATHWISVGVSRGFFINETKKGRELWWVWMCAVFTYMLSPSIVVVKVDVGKKDQKIVFLKDQFLLRFLCFVLGCFIVLAFFNEESCIFKWLKFFHNPKITLNIKLQIQLCAFAIAVGFIKR